MTWTEWSLPLKPWRYIGALLLLLCIKTPAAAQLFPGLSGETLADAIRNEYTPGQLLNDTQVKDTLYARVFLDADSVRCFYSGLARLLPDGVDPSQWLYGSGLEVESINLEHGWPQAKGAGKGTDGNTNMYHLFPSRSGINSDRANFPYSEIADAITQKWYYKGVELSNKPVTNIHLYSEFAGGSFEPRESVKGDIARAMFYFWTIYRQDALEADPAFFELQLPYLCQWHESDPVDEPEAARNEIIAFYQDGKVNPFILDCSLVQRAYCSQLSECLPVATSHVSQKAFDMQFLAQERRVLINGEDPCTWFLKVMDTSGRLVASDTFNTNEMSKAFVLPCGYYYVLAISPYGTLNLAFFMP